MKTYWLKITLKSDTAFGRGDGVAGVVDAEVQHDENGLPYLGGKTLKGLLGAMSDEILFALTQAAADKILQWQQIDQRLFGKAGNGWAEAAVLHVSDARLPADLRASVAYDRSTNPDGFSREQVLQSLTQVRRQTAMDAESGAPQRETLRTVRVIVRETSFVSRLDFMQQPSAQDLALLAACIKAFRRAGTGRNRGSGCLVAELYDQNPERDSAVSPITDTHFALFCQEIQP